jgi:hypothetical protein
LATTGAPILEEIDPPPHTYPTAHSRETVRKFDATGMSDLQEGTVDWPLESHANQARFSRDFGHFEANFAVNRDV